MILINQMDFLVFFRMSCVSYVSVPPVCIAQCADQSDQNQLPAVEECQLT